MELDEEIEIIRKLSFSEALPNNSAKDKVKIYVRLKPQQEEPQKKNKKNKLFPNKKTIRGSNNAKNEQNQFIIQSNNCLVAQAPQNSKAARTDPLTSFLFSQVFDPAVSQEVLFETTTKPMIEEALIQQTNCLLFAYGITNSGKTYTIQGNDEKPGILPQTLEHIFGLVAENGNDISCVKVSYIEIYNENVYDLLVPATGKNKRPSLRLQEREGKVFIRNANESTVNSTEEALNLLFIGNKNRQVASTGCNDDSSRSHCIFTLQFYRPSKRSRNLELVSKFSIVDLAGSERASKTKCSNERLKEASKINGSLMNLMRCLVLLRWNQQHFALPPQMIPFRQSKLTRIFQEFFLGKSAGSISMIVTISSMASEFDETLHTLKYSAIAKEIVHAPTVAEVKKVTKVSAPSVAYDENGRKKRKHSDIIAEDVQGDDSKPSYEELVAENESLKSHIAEMESQQLELEMSIREKVGIEMEKEMTAMKDHYNGNLQKYKQVIKDYEASQSKLESSERRIKRTVANELQKKTEQLENSKDKVRECEEEICRMREYYEREIELAKIASTFGALSKDSPVCS